MKSNDATDKFYTELFKKLEILEVEGRYFALNKSALVVSERPRTDKTFNLEIAHIMNNPDMKILE